MSEINDPKTFLLEDRTRETNGVSTVRRRRHTVFVVSVASVVIMAVLLTIILAITLSASPRGGSNGGQSNCITPDVCNSNILNYIDDSFDPCDDFFNYSCGKWLSANPLNGRSQWDIFSELIADNNKHLSGYLARPVQNNDPDAIKKSKYIYSACMDVQFIQNNYVEHLRDFIRNAGGWEDIGIFPDEGWDINDEGWDINDDLANDHYLGSPAFFTNPIRPDDLNSSKLVIKVSQGGLSLSSPQQYYNDLQNLVSKIKAVLDRVRVNGSTGDTLSMARDIAGYERALALNSLTDTELRNLSAIYNPMTLAQLSNLFNLDWVRYFNTLSGNADFQLNFTSDTVVIVETPEYFKNISRVVFNTNNHNATVKYAKWQLLYSEYTNFAAAFSNDGIKKVHKSGFPLMETTSQAQACAQAVQMIMPLAIARPFVEEFITAEVVDQVNETLNNVFKAFIERLMENDWLDQVTKGRCIDKVNAISKRIGYPDFIKNNNELDEYYEKLEINSSSNYFEIVAAFKEFQYFQQFTAYMMGHVDKATVWTEAPTTVNAYYVSSFNQITILAGILRVPFFAINWPPFLLYGAIGTVLGHELTHGFDDQGRQYDKKGNRVQWWMDESINQFNQHAQCFVKQYSSYSLQGYQVDGQLTLGENIADNGGIHTAYRAYKNAMNQIGHDEPLIGGHTHDQLFFVAFSQLYCSRYSSASLENAITDTHSPDPVRVLGSMSNSEDFSTAFKCHQGSRMNPDIKCQLW